MRVDQISATDPNSNRPKMIRFIRKRQEVNENATINLMYLCIKRIGRGEGKDGDGDGTETKKLFS